jgi:dihydroneopterin aldolase
VTGTPDDRLELRGLRVLGTHGALPEERVRPQPFELDLDVCFDAAPAAVSDRLEDTVDYGSLIETAVEVVAGPGHLVLLETLAARTAEALLASDDRVAVVEVAVRKLRPPVPFDLVSAGVRVRRERS